MDAPCDRKFYEIQPPEQLVNQDDGKENRQELCQYIRDNIIGKDTTFMSPFGRRRVVYCDYTASGKSLTFIEDYIREEVLPLYGNTHTTTSVTALQTTLYRHEARDIIRNAVNAGERDAVIFAGSGCTGAVSKLVNALGCIQDCVVFVSLMEHHSNLLPWKEAGAEVITIDQSEDGTISLTHLEKELQKHQGRNLIGSFNICSNVTGVLEDDLAITALLHRYGSLSFWDYASAAPYVNIDMNPKVPEDTHGLCYKDAIYFSMHKFVGGAQTPGVLVAKKYLFRSRTPNEPGGGTVFFVSKDHHRYLQDLESREEGGTPYIVESIRAGLAMKLKQSVGSFYIMEEEHKMRARALEQWRQISNLVILGPDSKFQLPIISFLIKNPETGLFLHFNYVVALLNDLFGLQTRGGCACAGLYMQYLLGLDKELADAYEDILIEDDRLDRIALRRDHEEHSLWEVFRPGATRLNLSWFSDPEEVDFIIEAVSLVAKEGWKLLPVYRFNNETGDWYHSLNTKFKDRRWLGHITFKNGKMEQLQGSPPPNGAAPGSYTECLQKAKEIIGNAVHLAQREVVPDQSRIFPPEISHLRWFLTPYEAKTALLTPTEISPLPPPFTPIRYTTGSQAVPGCLLGDLNCTYQTLHAIISTSTSKFTSWTLQPSSPKVRKPSEPTNGVEEKEVPKPKPGKEEEGRRKQDEGRRKDEEGRRSLETLVGSVLPDSACNDGTCIIPGGKRKGPIPSLTPNTAKWKAPSKEIFKPFLEAVTEFSMIRNGDKVLVGLSGGKDSLSLLHTIRQYTYYAARNGIKFSMGAVTVDPMSSAYDPRPLIPYLQQLGVEYLYEQQDIMTAALKVDASSICAFCSRMKRGRIYAAARRAGYNVIALGQHLDDLSESFFMSLFHNGRLRTMKAHYTNAEGDIRIIRPFVYLRENSLRHFAESQKLPIIAENCPACFEAPKERQRVKQLLAQQELLFPRLYWNLKTALYPVMRINKTGLESDIFGKHPAHVAPSGDAILDPENAGNKEDDDEDF